MTTIYHAFISNLKENEGSIFQSFLDYLGSENIVSSRVDSNPFTGSRILNVEIDENYVISVQYDEGDHLLHEYPGADKPQIGNLSRVRILLGNDPDNSFDDIFVIALQFLEEIKSTLVYSLEGEEYVPVA